LVASVAFAAAVGGHNPVTTFTRMERPGTVNIYANVRALARRADAVPNEQHSGRL
jgi:hypothetical protein